MKQLDVEWRKAGYSGKEDNDRLWAEFSQTKESFWNSKKALINAKFEAELSDKEAKLACLKSEVEDLKYRIEIAETPSMKEGFERDIILRSSQIEDVENEISILRDKIRG